MQIQTREARKEDIPQMQNLYKEFSKTFVGPTQRDLKHFRRMLRKKDNVNWVALDSQNRVIGYAHARIEKRTKQGEFEDIVVDPKYDFEQIARPLGEKVANALTEKKPTAIVAGSLRNPAYERIFPPLGFFESESTGVFMYAILDTQKFLHELTTIFASRLKEMKKWNGLIQIECDGHSVFVQKVKETTDPIVWSNQPVDFKVTLNSDTLIRLIFSIADPIEANQKGQLKVETAQDQTTTNQLLKVLFPKRQFLIMDYW